MEMTLYINDVYVEFKREWDTHMEGECNWVGRVIEGANNTKWKPLTSRQVSAFVTSQALGNNPNIDENVKQDALYVTALLFEC